jgi:heptosyltransferase-2
MEAFVRSASRMHSSRIIDAPKSIFVLRNNDIGDLLVVTPLFQALKERFPNASIVAGVGSWNQETLELNPYVSEIVTLTAPWHNQVIQKQGLLAAMKYIYTSPEVGRLKREHFDIGIDVVGSQFGSLLMLQADIPYRLGVRGFAGGDSACAKYVQYNQHEQVGRSALRFAELLGATQLPEVRPQIFLSEDEKANAEKRWTTFSPNKSTKRIIIGPGGGFEEKRWPISNFIELANRLSEQAGLEIIIVGGKQDNWDANAICAKTPCTPNSLVHNLVGKLTLRETFALTASANLVICNSSMLMHVAAAFCIPSVVLLGPYFDSAEQHQAQWGYPDLCWNLGKGQAQNTIYSPQQALKIIGGLLKT